jgi:hypothetical protein
MLYAVLCYHDEETVWAGDEALQARVMSNLAEVGKRLTLAGKMGPSYRLLPTTSAVTLRKDQDPPLVVDGPFAETKEALLGFYIIEVDDLDDALGVARELAKANPGGAYEVRPIAAVNEDRRVRA